MSIPSATPQATGPMPRKRVVSYALGDVANNVSFMMTSMFLMAYMTDIAGVPAAMAGTIYGLTKIWAGCTDLLAGNTVGRRDTRHGRLRPWLIWVSPLLAISLVLLFSTPAGLSGLQAFVWILLFDAAFQLCYSFVNIPYGSLSAAMTQDPVDRSRLAGARAIASSVTGVLLAVALSPQFQNTQADNIRLKFTIATLALSALALVLYWLCFRGCREVIPRSPGKITLRNTLAMVGKNRPLLVLCLAALFLLAAAFTMNSVMMYFARNVLGGARNFIWLQLAQTVGTVAVASAVPAITVRFGKRIGYLALAGVACVGFVLMGLVPTGPSGLLLALVAFLVYGVGFGGTNALMFSMQADTVDYGEWQSGTRAEGGAYSILSFIRKSGQGIGGFVGGGVIAAFGYVGGVPQQSESAIQGIKIATGFVPAALCLVAALVIFFYPLGADQHRRIVSDLNERRAQRAAGDEQPVATGPVVTINEQYGAGGATVARQVAQRLGVPYVGPRFSSEQLEQLELEQLGRDGHAQVEPDPATASFLRSLSRTTVDADATIAVDAQTDRELVLANTSELVSLVAAGGVVVGRDGVAVLGAVPGALHVRLVGSVGSRVARAAREGGITEQLAGQRQQREDALRTAMSQRLMTYDPADASHYDLVIDTGAVDLAETVERIVAAVQGKRGG